MSISNIVESFVPIMPDRNYAPTRTFITKWDVEIENNRTKKISRRREHDTKYFDYSDDLEKYDDSLPPIVDQSDQSVYDSSDDGEGEETRQAWLRAVHAENAYYERKYGELKDNFDWYDLNQPPDQRAPSKRNIDFDEYGILKRSRAL
jgi:hypothetical protein